MAASSGACQHNGQRNAESLSRQQENHHLISVGRLTKNKDMVHNLS